MTESDWQASTSGLEMGLFAFERLTDRKLTLLACGLARRFLLPLAVVGEIERRAARSWTPAEADRAVRELTAAGQSYHPLPFVFSSDELVPALARPREYLRGRPITAEEDRAAAHLLREQLGNPFRPYPFDPRWRTETVVALATGIEAERAFDRMPILADALEEAGCDWAELLDHLRGPGPHAVGCWALDLILDREPDLFALPPLVPTPRRMRLGPFTPPPENMA